MRTLNSGKNFLVTISLMVTMTLLGFVTRKLFVNEIGVEYLGLNGLLTNILAAVTLLESGFGTSVVVHLYKPLAANDQPRILALLQFYRKVYRIIAAAVLFLCLCLYPFLGCFIRDEGHLDYLTLVYFIFVFNSILPYLTAYKNSLINADQKNYRLGAINFVYQVGLNLSKLAILYWTGNYVLYLVVESLFLAGFNVAMVRKVNALYPYVRSKVFHALDTVTKSQIVLNVKALFLHSLGGYFMHSTSNIVISSFVGLAAVGFYSNYMLVVGTISTFIMQVINSMAESVGNLIASEDRGHVYEIFKRVFLINFLISGVSSIVLLNTLNPFIVWWLGPDYVLSGACSFVIILNFFVVGMRRSAMVFKTKAGIFHQDRYSPLLQGVLNVVLSVTLVQWWGMTGVLLAATLSLLSIGVWQFPRLVYRHVFHQPLRKYFITYGWYVTLAGAGYALTYPLCSRSYFSSPLADLCMWGGISVIVPLGLDVLFLFRTSPFRGLMGHMRTLICR